MLYAGLAGDLPALARLADRCAAAGRRVGIATDDRRFRPHLTLARARRTTADMTGPVQALAAYDGPRWSAEEVLLLRSHLGPPVVHETLARLPLARPDAHQA